MDGEDEDRPRIARLGARSPGEDDSDPYEDVDISDLPEWWRRAIETFREHDLRPYRPPRFEDGTLKHEVIDQVEAELDVDIRLACFNARHGDDWTVYVNGEQIGEIGHRRSPDGYSVFEIGSDEFVSFVRSNA